MDSQERIKTIGVIDKILHGDHCRVKIIATKDHENINILTSGEQEKLFPPIGYVFGIAFFKNHPNLNQYDLIEFESVRNQRIDEENTLNDLFMISSGSVKKHFINTISISNVISSNYSIDLSRLKVDTADFSGDFYGYTSNKIYGKLRFQGEVIRPASQKHIFVWDKSECKTLEYKNKLFLLEEPTGDHLVFDCMDDYQLFEWFRENLKKLDFDYVNQLDIKTKWRDKIPTLFKESNKGVLSLEKTRLERIEEKIKHVDLSIERIKYFVENSENLKRTFESALETHKDELSKEYTEQIQIFREEFEIKRNKYCKRLEQLEQIIETKEQIVELKTTEVFELEAKLEKINMNKERILSDFTIVKDVLGITNISSNIDIYDKDSYVMEVIKRSSDSLEMDTKEKYILKLKYELYIRKLFPNFAKKIVDSLSIFKGIFIKNIELGIAIIESTGEAKYIIQHVEPDWLHFKDLWNNGLSAIWASAQENPHIIHFLLLEDINMSSPECYARPLLDILRGVRKRIPYSKTKFPDNLKILAIKASTEEPEIGLKLNKDTFRNWGSIGYSGNINKEIIDICEKVNGYINLNNLNLFKPEEFSEEEILYNMQNEYDKLFDN